MEQNTYIWKIKWYTKKIKVISNTQIFNPWDTHSFALYDQR